MVGDVAGAMDAEAAEGEERILRAMLSRVRAWQEFMRKGAQALSPEAEIGLVGELSFLRLIIEAGVPAVIAVESWVGRPSRRWCSPRWSWNTWPKSE
ncbi:MAG: PD-(D/E)XK motif protein [Pseudomonadota bacterium]